MSLMKLNVNLSVLEGMASSPPSKGGSSPKTLVQLAGKAAGEAEWWHLTLSAPRLLPFSDLSKLCLSLEYKLEATWLTAVELHQRTPRRSERGTEPEAVRLQK